jgi:hypothetical protein
VVVNFGGCRGPLYTRTWPLFRDPISRLPDLTVHHFAGFISRGENKQPTGLVGRKRQLIGNDDKKWRLNFRLFLVKDFFFFCFCFLPRLKMSMTSISSYVRDAGDSRQSWGFLFQWIIKNRGPPPSSSGTLDDRVSLAFYALLILFFLHFILTPRETVYSIRDEKL